MSQIICLDRLTEKYKPFYYMNAYSTKDQNLNVDTITIFEIENIREKIGINIYANKITFDQDGCYMINCSLNIGVTSANQVSEIFYTCLKNNNDIDGVGGRLSLISGNTKYSCHFNFIVKISDYKNDYLQFAGFTTLNNVYISKEISKFLPNDIPTIPSINITITQIS